VTEFDKLVRKTFELIDEHIKKNNKGLFSTYTTPDYWCGRLYESEEFKRDFKKLLKEFYLKG